MIAVLSNIFSANRPNMIQLPFIISLRANLSVFVNNHIKVANKPFKFLLMSLSYFSKAGIFWLLCSGLIFCVTKGQKVVLQESCNVKDPFGPLAFIVYLLIMEDCESIE